MFSLFALFIIIVGCTTIGSIWLGTYGSIIGFIGGCYLFYVYNKKR